MTDNPLHLLFLDWKQAFDSVNHTALLIALKRFGVPEDCLGLISSIYDAPTFEIKGLNGKVAQGEVAAGIRQGCPLSPYLFIMLLTVILKDVDDLLRRQGTPTNTWSINHPTFDVEYADDTLLIGLTTPQLEQMLRAIETDALCYGMRLNATKTELLINECCPPAEIRFVNGDIVPTTTQAKYLGSMVSWNMPFRTAFKHRCALAEEAYKKLRLVWNSSLPRRVKLRIFQAIYPAVLTYGLDSFTLTDGHLQQIDAFYFRFLRRIIGTKASFYSRIPNSEVYQQANRPKRPSEFIQDAQFKMMYEVFFSSDTDPIHNVVFEVCLKDRITQKGRRRGRSIPYWLVVTTKRYFPHVWEHDHTANNNWKYVLMSREMRNSLVSGEAPKRAQQSRARH